jgi:Tfp pilus assembly protein FimV
MSANASSTVIELPAMVNTQTPQQKAAATRAANRAAKQAAAELAAIAATETPATTPATETPATTPAKPAKASPIRKDVQPADVKAAEPKRTAEESKEIATLESLAARWAHNGQEAAERLANTLVKLYPLRPWEGRKLANGHLMTVKSYFDSLGNAFVGLNTDARRGAVKSLNDTYPDMEIDTVVAILGSSPRTIARDRAALGIVNETRQAANTAAAARTPTATESAEEHTPVTRMVPVLSMTSVREFINGLDDVEMLAELEELIAQRIQAL